VLTWSGVASVSNAYYDVARTLGAKPSFLVLKSGDTCRVAACLRRSFMGLGSSFAVLVVAEMIGVKAGLGWYLQWAQGWAAYANMYRRVDRDVAIVLRRRSRCCSGPAIICSSGQKGVVKW